MKRVAAEIDSRAGWPVHACVYAERPRLVEVKNPTQVIGVEAPALNHSEPRGRRDETITAENYGEGVSQPY